MGITGKMGAIMVAGLFAISSAHAQHDHDHDHDHDHASEAPAKDEHAGHDHGDEGGHHGEEHHDEATLTPEAIQLYGVTIAMAEKQVLTDLITVPARVALNGDAMAHVGTSVEGRIVELPVKVGDMVAKGDILAIVDSPALGEAQSEFLQRRNHIAVARTTVDVTRKSFERGRELEPGKGITLSEFQKREGELRLAESTLMSAESAARAAENKLHLFGISQQQVEELIKSGEISPRVELRAPLDGEVIEREVTLGEVIAPDRESLMVIADMSTLWVLAEVPEKDIARVGKGDASTVTFGSLHGLSFTGKVAHLAPVLDARTRKGTVRIEVSGQSTIPETYTPEEIAAYKAKNDWCPEHDKPESKCPECNPSLASKTAPLPADVLRAGMFGEAELALSARPGQSAISLVAVPVSAVQTVEGGPAVFVPVEGEANTFAKRAITVGPRMGRWIPVLSGLNDGEAFVEAGSFILKAELGKEGAAHEH